MADNRTRTYNTLTAIILAVTLGICLLVVFLAATTTGQTMSAEPTLIDPSVETPTIEAPTANPTSTGDAAAEAIVTLTVTPSPSPSKTPTEMATETPTPTETDVADETEEAEELTATPTEEASPTNTPTATLTATVSGSASDYEYVLREDEIEYVSNFANDAGCDWMGIAGEVVDAEGEPVTELYIHVTDDDDFDMRVKSGDMPAYGDSGWEVYLAAQPVEATYTVQLETEDGEQLSEAVSVQTTDSCDMNLVLLVFEQTS